MRGTLRQLDHPQDLQSASSHKELLRLPSRCDLLFKQAMVRELNADADRLRRSRSTAHKTFNIEVAKKQTERLAPIQIRSQDFAASHVTFKIALELFAK